MDKNGKTTHRLNIYYTVLKALIMSSTLRLLMQWYKGIYCGRLSRHELCGSGCDKAGSEGIRAASTWAAPLFSFPTTSLLCCWLSVCQSVCPFISLSVCLKPARVYLHFSSTSIFMMEAGHSTWRCVCVCMCVRAGLNWAVVRGDPPYWVPGGEGAGIPLFGVLCIFYCFPPPPPVHADAPVAMAQDAFSLS